MSSGNDLSLPKAALPGANLVSRLCLAILVCGCVWVAGAVGQTTAPLLVVTDATYTDNPFGDYVSEMLKTEGFQAHHTADISTIDLAYLNDYQLVILAEMLLGPAQEQAIRDYVSGGGKLVVFRPDPVLEDLCGLDFVSTRLQPDLPQYEYLSVETATDLGAGLVDDSFQYYGAAELYDLVTAEAVAWLHDDEATPSAYPAVVHNGYGSGHVVAFTYDPTRSVVYIRQGNPEWACYNLPDEGQCEDADGAVHPGIRPDDLFRRGVAPEDYWIDLAKCRIPQADLHQRLLGNAIMELTAGDFPLPRLWYLPDGLQALLMMTHDSDSRGVTAFDEVFGVVESYGGNSTIYLNLNDIGGLGDNAPVAADVDRWRAAGHEVSIHFDDTAEYLSPTRAGMEAVYDWSMTFFETRFGSLPDQTTRHHYLVWYGWATTAEISAAHGIHLDTNNYHNGYHPEIDGELPQGYQTGSGLPQRFITEEGLVVNDFQVMTNFAEHSQQIRMGMTVAECTQLVNELFDAALTEFPTAFCANFHHSMWGTGEPWARNMMQAAVDRDMPIITAQAFYDFVAARDAAIIGDIAWDGSDLSFSLTGQRAEADVPLMLPVTMGLLELEAVNRNGAPIAFTIESVAGRAYAFILTDLVDDRAGHQFTAHYAADEDEPVISDVQVTDVTEAAATVTWQTDEPATSWVEYGDSPAMGQATSVDPTLVTSHSVTITDLAAETPYYFVVHSADDSGNPAVSDQGTFTTLAYPPDCWTETSLADFTAGTPVDVQVGETDNGPAGGELRLVAALQDLFLEPSLDIATWSPELSPGYDFSIADGIIDLADPGGAVPSHIVSVATFGPGSVVEGRVMMQPGSPYLSFGFAAGPVPQTEFVLFATLGTGGDASPVIYAASWDDSYGSGNYVMTATGAALDAWHHFKIVWKDTPAETEFWLDGALVTTHDTTDITGPAQVFIRKGGDYHDSSYLVDWVRVTPYAPLSGSFESVAGDAGSQAQWLDLTWTGDEPSGTSLGFETRSGPTPVPDGSWSTWSPLSGNSVTSPDARYLQWRSSLTTTDAQVSPALQDVRICFMAYPDETPPQVVGNLPLAGATDVPTTSSVTATFSEAMAPASLSTATFTLSPQGGGPAVAAVVTYDGPSLTATLDPSADLDFTTVYEARVTTGATDEAGNPLETDFVWTFTTWAQAPDCLVETTVADFAAGNHVGTTVAESDHATTGGQLRLASPLSDLFLTPPLDTSVWQAVLDNNPAAPVPFTPTISDGILDVADPAAVQRSKITSLVTYGPGTIIEARVMFLAGSASVHFGFSEAESQDEWILFGTRGTGGDPEPVIYASSNDVDVYTAPIDTPTALALGEWHTLRIVWLGSSAEFWADGQLVTTHDTQGAITQPAHAFLRKAPVHDSSFLVDWVRVTPYDPTTGTYTSVVFDAANPSQWYELTAAPEVQPAGTTVQFETRTGATPAPDGSWSDWEAVSGTAIASPTARYLQYRATLSTSDAAQSSVVDAVQLCYFAGEDLEPPEVIDATPAADAVEVAVTTAVIATFSEVLDPATVDETTFTLTPQGGGLPVAATVDYVAGATTATLTPTADLGYLTTYEARVTTGVTDLAGNPLLADHVWSFTTEVLAPDACAGETSVADFTAGSHTGTVVTEADNGADSGEIRLSPVLNDVFMEPSLDASLWLAEQPPGYAPDIVDGILNVADPGGAAVSSILSQTTFGPGTILEGRVQFQPGSAYVHFGLVANPNVWDEWLLFSTQGTGDDATPIIHASVYDNTFGSTGNAHNTPLAVTFNAWHVFKIVWGASTIEFWVDGALLSTHDASLITEAANVFIRKAQYHDSDFLIDWIRITPYAAVSGVYESAVHDAGEPTNWLDLTWTSQEPTGTAATFETRTGDTATPDGDWSPWAALDGVQIQSPLARYVQYRASLSTGDPTISPVLSEVTLTCSSCTGVPDALTDLVADQVMAGNPPGETTGVRLSWQTDVPSASVMLYRKGFGNYPEYDDGPEPGAVPTPPADPDAAVAEGWTHVVDAVGLEYLDTPPYRDFWYYVGFVRDACGQVSAVSNQSAGTLNYHLGDVYDGATPGVGDNIVTTNDVTRLALGYGTVHDEPEYRNFLDVGPLTPEGRPATDDMIQFEDLVIFAINFHSVGKEWAPPPVAAENWLSIAPAPLPEVGETYTVALQMSGDGRIQGLSVPVTWDTSILELLGAVPGELLALQGGQNLLLSPEPGLLDIALIGVREQGISGEGVLAELKFRVLANGEPDFALGTIDARSAANEVVVLEGEVAPAVPRVTTLHPNVPNPFNPRTRVSFDLAVAGAVRVEVYAVDGRRVSTLTSQHYEPGYYALDWNGTDDQGRRLASGVYMLRLVTPDRSQVQKMLLMK